MVTYLISLFVIYFCSQDVIIYLFSVIDIMDSKPLIKLIKNRIEVIRRKRNATQKFLKKDIADLLANGLDINAYGRVILYLYLDVYISLF